MSLVAPSIVRASVLTSSRPLLCRSSLCLRQYALSGVQARCSSTASTALKVEVREEEKRDEAPVVGEEVKGAEGRHFQDQMAIADPASPLNDLGRTGPWTLMNPIYTEAELDSVKIVHRPTVTTADRLARGAVIMFRRVFDFATGYRKTVIPDETLRMRPLPIAELRAKGLLLGPKEWLTRIIILESIAGVPGMVGGTLRHLSSLRLLRRDGGWIHTLLEEAENERMHLLTFMTIAQPGWFTRLMVLAAQGTFYNAFFLTYLFSPRVAHRFVGCLEEEAVRTYTHCLHDIELGLVPEWENVPAPRIAIDYWRLPTTATLLDVIRAVRADEATHRFVNHSLADLDHKRDFNPFALGEPTADVRGATYGFTREQSANFVRQKAALSAKLPVEQIEQAGKGQAA